MVNKCSVPNCRGNYRGEKKSRVFSFPKDENLRKKWISAIRRHDFQPATYSRVCEQHFSESDFLYEEEAWDSYNNKIVKLTLTLPRLKEGVVPSILPNCPSYLSKPSTSRESADERRSRLERQQLMQAIRNSNESQARYEQDNSFSSWDQFLNWLEKAKVPECWTVVRKESVVLFLNLDIDHVPVIKCSVIINRDLKVRIFRDKLEIRKIGKISVSTEGISTAQTLFKYLDNLHLLCTDSNVSSSGSTSNDIIINIEDLLQQLVDKIDKDNVNVIDFVKEQLNLLICEPFKHRYSTNFMIFCSLLYTISPHSYKFLRNAKYVILPHPQTVAKICSRHDTSPVNETISKNFLSYVKKQFPFLKPSDHTVSLMLDEIYIKPFLDFKGGNIIGSSHSSEILAKSAFVFMLQSIQSSFKEVVHILPVSKINALELFEVIKRVIIGLEEIGFHVICIVTDNNPVNKSAIGRLKSPPGLSIVYQNPAHPEKPLFYLFDSVHLLKCIRNNWINQKDSNQSLKYPSFDQCQQICNASFADLKKMHAYEQNNLLQFSRGLNLKSLYPSTFERQNVKLALNIFNENVIQGLLTLENECSLTNAKQTADFIQIICNWWSVVNVKTIFKGLHSRDILKNPLSVSGENFEYLEKFLNWLDRWESSDITNRLSRETHLALSHSTYCLIELTKYCLDEKHLTYILPGKFQTDGLEDRFGKYRTLAGSQYLISLRQLYEVENKLRLQNYLPMLTLNSSLFGSINVNLNESSSNSVEDIFPCSSSSNEDNQFVDVEFEFSEIDFLNLDEILPVITYISGYCVRGVICKLKCKECSDNLVINKDLELPTNFSLLRNLDRGGLSYPIPDIVNVVVFNYLTLNKLISNTLEKKFITSSDQKHVLINITEKIIMNADFFMNDLISCKIHSKSHILRLILKTSSNILLNNYVKLRNNSFSETKKRKLQTLQS